MKVKTNDQKLLHRFVGPSWLILTIGFSAFLIIKAIAPTGLIH